MKIINRAFTLIEILIGATVFVLVFMGIYTFYSKMQKDVYQDTNLNFFLSDYGKFQRLFKEDLDKAELNITLSNLAHFPDKFDPTDFKIIVKGVKKEVKYIFDKAQGKLYREYEGKKRVLISKNLEDVSLKPFIIFYSAHGVPSFMLGVKAVLTYNERTKKKGRKVFSKIFFLENKLSNLVVNRRWVD